MWVYLWSFYFVPLLYISVFVPVPYCLDDCGFVVEPEVRQVDSENRLFYVLISFWPCPVACGILVPLPRIEPMPPALEAQSLNHWTTREVLIHCLYISFFACLSICQYLMSSIFVSFLSHLFPSIQGIERESREHPHHCFLGEPSPDALFSLSLLSSYLDSTVWRKDSKRGSLSSNTHCLFLHGLRIFK